MLRLGLGPARFGLRTLARARRRSARLHARFGFRSGWCRFRGARRSILSGAREQLRSGRLLLRCPPGKISRGACRPTDLAKAWLNAAWKLCGLNRNSRTFRVLPTRRSRVEPGRPRNRSLLPGSQTPCCESCGDQALHFDTAMQHGARPSQAKVRLAVNVLFIRPVSFGRGQFFVRRRLVTREGGLQLAAIERTQPNTGCGGESQQRT